MRYKFNEKFINIPDEDIQRTMAGLKVSKDEAIQIWLEDEGKLDNDEQNELDAKAKQVKIKMNAHTFVKRPQKPRERKPDKPKEDFIKALAEWLETSGYENVKVTNVTKMVDFTIGADSFSLNLIRHRPPKK